jgi:hypothetical protein
MLNIDFKMYSTQSLLKSIEIGFARFSTQIPIL